MREYYGDCVRVELHHFPVHKQPWDWAIPAAEASMAANAQGKFWEMSDKIFHAVTTMNHSVNVRMQLDWFASEIGLDMALYRSDINSGGFLEAVEADKARGDELGVRGVPTFFINGEELGGAQPFDEFKKVIDAQLDMPVDECRGPGH